VKKPNFRRVFTLAGLVSLAMIYALLWTRMITSQEQRVGADFIGHYTAGRLVQSDGYPAIYNIVKQQQVQAQVVGFIFDESQTGYFTHPPFIVPLVSLITSGNYVNSFIRWTLILLALNILSAFLLVRTLPPGYFRKNELWIIGLGTFLFFPTFSGLMNGQDTLLLLLGTAIWLYEIQNNRDLRAGLGLSLVTIRPQMAILMAIPFLLKRRKIFWGFVIGGAVLVLISLALIRVNGLLDYVTILRVVENGMWDHPHAVDMPTISGILRRSFSSLDQGIYRSIMWGGFVAGIAGICIWWGRVKEINEQHIGLLCLLALLFVPYAHYHELTMLLIPTFCLMRLFARKNIVSGENLAWIPVALSILMMLGFIGSGVLKYPIVYLIMALLGYFLLFPEKIYLLTKKRTSSPEGK
jgi:hypothetical protein